MFNVCLYYTLNAIKTVKRHGYKVKRHGYKNISKRNKNTTSIYLIVPTSFFFPISNMLVLLSSLTALKIKA